MKRTTRKINSQEGILLNFLDPLTKVGLSLMKNVLKPLAKIIFISLGLTAAASPTDTAIQNKIYGSALTTLIISNEETKDILEIVIT